MRPALILFFLSFFLNTFYLFSAVQVLFSPDNNLRDNLISLIDNSKSRVYAAVFMLTDKAIANSLIRAKERNVDVQVISDQSCIISQFGKIEFLKKEGIQIFSFCPISNKNNKISSKNLVNNVPIMHNKFAIIDNKIWTGSFNWTRAANDKNFENAVIISEELSALDRFLKQFEIIKRQCMHQRPIKNKSSSKPISRTVLQKQIYDFLQNVREKFRKNNPEILSKPSRNYVGNFNLNKRFFLNNL